MGSDYFTTTPEMKGPGEVAAAAASGNYGAFHVPVNVDGSAEEYQQQVKLHSFFLQLCSPLLHRYGAQGPVVVFIIKLVGKSNN